jgi:hypothetical protein
MLVRPSLLKVLIEQIFLFLLRYSQRCQLLPGQARRTQPTQGI